MQKPPLPIYQIQDFKALEQKECYFYCNTLANHLKEHDFIREPHKHNFYILIFITQGSGTHTIDFKKYEAKPDTVFFMIPGQVHSWALSVDADGFVLFFTPEFYFSRHPNKKLSGYPFFNAFSGLASLLIYQPEKEQMLELIEKIRDEYQHDRILRNDMLGNYLDIVLIQLTRIYQMQGAGTTTLAGEFTVMQLLENLIDKHFKDHQPVTFYADKLHITTRQLKEICKRVLDKTTTELIQDRVILEAKRLLVHSEFTSSQVADALGYFDNAYFFRVFKKHTGLTPEQFRALNK